ncbi:MAG: DUF938 domain-containing protein [Cyanobacteria bacterium J06648_16]
MPYFTTSDHCPDARQYAAATERNRVPILTVLRQVLPPEGTILEVASGTGQHAAFFAPQLVPRYWLPSDPQPPLRASIQAWREWSNATNLLPPADIDAAVAGWNVEAALPPGIPNITAIVNINMIHISPWAAGQGLLAGAGQLLPENGVLYLYGPYRRGGQHTAPSNAEFDAWLQSQNPAWGVRDLDAVTATAEDEGLMLYQVVEMPANNLSVVFRKAA